MARRAKEPVQQNLIPEEKLQVLRAPGPVIEEQLVGSVLVQYETLLRTKKQKAALQSWLDAGCPTKMVRLGQTRRNSVTGSGSFSTTWAERAPGIFGKVNVFRYEGDPRNAWRKFRDCLS